MNTHPQDHQRGDESSTFGEEGSATLDEVTPEVEEIIRKLPPDEQETVLASIEFSGPLPPPGILQGYSEVYPEAPEKIFSWVNNQMKHRHELEKIEQKRFHNNNRLSLILGFLLISFLIISALILIFLDKEVVGLSLLIPSLGTIIIGLFNSKNNKNVENNNEKE